MRNNNQRVIRKISDRTMKNSRMRNLFAIVAIGLTCLLFTAVFSMGFGMAQIFQENTMREVGGRFHAGLKHVTMEQYEKITANPKVKETSYNIMLGMADNVKKRQSEIRFAENEQEMKQQFAELKEGSFPQKEDELAADTITLKELGVPAELGAKVPLEFTFQGEKIKKEFTLCGWYEGSEISHASELFVSEAYWKSLKGNRTDKDFLEWNKDHPEDAGAGLVNGNIFFKTSRGIEENVRQIIEEAGYFPEGEEPTQEKEQENIIEYGVNWAYISSRMESMDMETVVMLMAVLVVILVTGYLIIYNIFQLSILKEIRFYGLLKTIGTTKKQLRRLVYRQALTLSLIGIPIGLLLGYGAGQLLVPLLMQMTSNEMLGGFRFSPWILVFGVVFSFFTVLLSSRKPAKLAGAISPVEAVRYTEAGRQKKRGKKTEKGAGLRRMAFANLGRNRKKTVIVIFSLSLSVILLELVMTAVGSFRIEEYLEERIAGDFMVGNANFTRTAPREYDFSIDKELLESADAMEGITDSGEVWMLDSMVKHTLSPEEKKTYQKFFEEKKLDTREEFGSDRENQIRKSLAAEQTVIEEKRYAYTESLLKKLKAVKGTIDLEKFRTGKYVLVQQWREAKQAEEGDSLLEPGEKVMLQSPGEDTEVVEDFDENGEYAGYHLSNMKEKEYEVMAVIKGIPDSMSCHVRGINELVTIVPLEDMKQTLFAERIAKSYTVEAGQQKAFEGMLKNYTENVNPSMGYLSKGVLVEEFSGMINGVSAVGYCLCAVIGLIGILNFANSMLTGILTRKQELAVMQSIGMTKEQIKQMLLWESGYYLGISGILSVVLGSTASYFAVGALNGLVRCFRYRYTAVPFLIMLPVFAVVSMAISLAAYSQTQKKSVVERLREGE